MKTYDHIDSPHAALHEALDELAQARNDIQISRSALWGSIGASLCLIAMWFKLTFFFMSLSPSSFLTVATGIVIFLMYHDLGSILNHEALKSRRFSPNVKLLITACCVPGAFIFSWIWLGFARASGMLADILADPRVPLLDEYAALSRTSAGQQSIDLYESAMILTRSFERHPLGLLPRRPGHVRILATQPGTAGQQAIIDLLARVRAADQLGLLQR